MRAGELPPFRHAYLGILPMRPPDGERAGSSSSRARGAEDHREDTTGARTTQGLERIDSALTHIAYAVLSEAGERSVDRSEG